MKQPHKHAELIKAWADGAEIEVFDYRSSVWAVTTNPTWNSELWYRIKPEPKPDVVVDECVILDRQYGAEIIYGTKNLRLTFDGETGKLKKAEVLE
jgi:hypothetical protein